MSVCRSAWEVISPTLYTNFTWEKPARVYLPTWHGASNAVCTLYHFLRTVLGLWGWGAGTSWRNSSWRGRHHGGGDAVVCVKNVVLLSLVPQIETWFLMWVTPYRDSVCGDERKQDALTIARWDVRERRLRDSMMSCVTLLIHHRHNHLRDRLGTPYLQSPTYGSPFLLMVRSSISPAKCCCFGQKVVVALRRGMPRGYKW
jgi:hypothetical protein